jgi:hypothetical protein
MKSRKLSTKSQFVIREAGSDTKGLSGMRRRNLFLYRCEYVRDVTVQAARRYIDVARRSVWTSMELVKVRATVLSARTMGFRKTTALWKLPHILLYKNNRLFCKIIYEIAGRYPSTAFLLHRLGHTRADMKISPLGVEM